MRRLVIAVGCCVLAGVAAASSAPLMDVLLAQVEARTIAASDIALARALHLLGFAPSTEPIERRDIERFADVLLILEEAGQIGLAADEPEVERAWAAMVAHVGSEAVLQQWLESYALKQAWVRRLVEADVLRARFFEARFAAFVFVGDEEITRVLGPGEHDETARERAREQITRETAEKAQAEWLVAARRRASIRILLPDGRSVEPPFPPPR
jgi:hypothetical protein